MNMLQTFFEIGTDPKIFEGLKISEDREFCEKYMGHFPVISISLKNVEGMNFESACAAMKYAIGAEALRFSFLEKSPELSETDKKMLGIFRHITKKALSYACPKISRK